MKKLILCGLIFCLFGFFYNMDVYAATINAASCSQSAVQTAINSTANGDTVTVPSGSCSWSGITISKNITLQGAGSISTLITGGSISIPTGSPRLTGFGFTSTTVSIGNANGWRVDNNKFTYSVRTYSIKVEGTQAAVHPTGLIDHNIFYNGEVLVYGDTNTYGTPANASGLWSLSDGLGAGTNAVFVEDNTFTWQSGATPPTSIDGNYGARFVFRYNNIISGGLEFHGIQGNDNRGVSRWEIYNNTFNITFAWYTAILIRSGGGVLFNNTFAGPFTNDITSDNQTSYRYGVYSCDGVSCDGNNPRDGNRSSQHGYPCRDQLGRGRDTTTWAVGQPYTQTLSPIYLWNNKRGASERSLIISTDSQICGSNPGYHTVYHVLENRDYYNGASTTQTAKTSPFNGTAGVGYGTLANRPDTCTTNPNEQGGGVAYWATDTNTLYRCSATNTWTVHYTPYTYPHPLTLASGGVTPSAPYLHQ